MEYDPERRLGKTGLSCLLPIKLVADKISCEMGCFLFLANVLRPKSAPPSSSNCFMHYLDMLRSKSSVFFLLLHPSLKEPNDVNLDGISTQCNDDLHLSPQADGSVKGSVYSFSWREFLDVVHFWIRI